MMLNLKCKTVVTERHLKPILFLCKNICMFHCHDKFSHFVLNPSELRHILNADMYGLSQNLIF